MEDDVFERAHRFVMRWEGGFCDDKGDPGGATKYGVSLRFLLDEGYDLNGDGLIDVGDVRAVTMEDARRIFHQHFWPTDFERLAKTHPRLAFAAYDTAVNMGLGTAKRLVQTAVGTQADGIWGPKTWGGIKDASDFLAASCLIDLRRNRYEALAVRNPNLKAFLRGWNNRLNDLTMEVSK